MTAIFWVVGFVSTALMIFTYSLCRVFSDCSRLEEANELI